MGTLSIIGSFVFLPMGARALLCFWNFDKLCNTLIDSHWWNAWLVSPVGPCYSGTVLCTTVPAIQCRFINAIPLLILHRHILKISTWTPIWISTFCPCWCHIRTSCLLHNIRTIQSTPKQHDLCVASGCCLCCHIHGTTSHWFVDITLHPNTCLCHCLKLMM